MVLVVVFARELNYMNGRTCNGVGGDIR